MVRLSAPGGKSGTQRAPPKRGPERCWGGSARALRLLPCVHFGLEFRRVRLDFGGCARVHPCGCLSLGAGLAAERSGVTGARRAVDRLPDHHETLRPHLASPFRSVIHLSLSSPCQTWPPWSRSVGAAALPR